MVRYSAAAAGKSGLVEIGDAAQERVKMRALLSHYLRAKSIARLLAFVIVPPLLVVLSGGGHAQCLAQENTALKKRFLEEAPAGWESYLTFAKNLQAIYTANTDLTNNGKATERLRFQSKYKLMQNAAVRIQHSLEPGTEGEVEGTNPAYSFKLKRASAERGWILVDLKITGPAKGPDKSSEVLQKEIVKASCPFLTLWNLWLPDLVRDADFKIKSIGPVLHDGGDLVRMEFDYPKAPANYPVPGALHISKGWVVFDPLHDWVVKEYEIFHVSSNAEVSINQRFEFNDGREHHPLCHGGKLFYKLKEGNNWAKKETQLDCEMVERPDGPITEFTLTAFGLPEPTGVVWPRATPYYVWFAIAAAVALLLALSFRYFARRAARKPPS